MILPSPVVVGYWAGPLVLVVRPSRADPRQNGHAISTTAVTDLAPVTLQGR